MVLYIQNRIDRSKLLDFLTLFYLFGLILSFFYWILLLLDFKLGVTCFFFLVTLVCDLFIGRKVLDKTPHLRIFFPSWSISKETNNANFQRSSLPYFKNDFFFHIYVIVVVACKSLKNKAKQNQNLWNPWYHFLSVNLFLEGPCIIYNLWGFYSRLFRILRHVCVSTALEQG